MSTSEEYLASLGFDTSDVDKAVNQTVTLLGHLGSQFEQVEKQTSKAERALLGTSRTTKNVGESARGAASGQRTLADSTRGAADASDRANDSTKKHNKGLLEQESILPRLRYALYDVAQVALTTSAAITGIGVATAAASASYESAFTNVERTVEPGSIAVEQLRQQLIGLSNEIPLTFQQLSGIATLGNQLGVEAQNIEGFTGTVARFSAVSGVAFEETAKSFGSMSEILGVAESDYERLGSSIALVGRRSVATEGEILSLTREIGQQAHQAGFTAEEVIGLSGALGELRVPPERARGSLTTYFQTLTQAVAEGGDRLEDFASVVGMSAQELSNAVREGQGLEVFQRFLTALGSAPIDTQVAALDRLGLSQLRVSDVFQRLASNTDVFNQSIANGRQGWSEGTELARQYALVLDDLNTRWQLFLNALMTFGAAVGDQVAPALTTLLDGASSVLQVLTGFVNSPAGEWAVRLAATILTLVAGYAALRGGIALATGAMLALRTAASALGGAGILANLRALAIALGIIRVNANNGKVSITGLTTALRGIGKATVVIAILQLLTEALFDMKGAGEVVIDVLTGIAQSVVAAARIISDFIGSIPGGGVFSTWADGLQVAHDELGNFRRDAKREWGNFARDMGWMSEETTDFGDAAMEATPFVDEFASGIGDVGNAAGDAAPEVRTLVDYANDLSQVMTRAFDIRFGPTQAFDQITSSWNAIRQAIEDTNTEIAQYRSDMAQLSSDRDIREYWLRVAENYGDALRAGQLRAEISEIDADLSKKSGALTKAQEKNSKTLVGNSEAAVANRASILGLVQGYQSYIEKLAAAGVPQEELYYEAQRMRQEFISQATQLGYNQAELDVYARAFDDVTLAIQRVPRNITVAADINPAIQALNELQARAQSLSGQTYSGPRIVGGGVDANAEKALRFQAIQAEIAALEKGASLGIGGLELGSRLQTLRNQLRNGSYRSGTAWTGSGPAGQIAGVVHNRERVLNERGSQLVSGQFVNAANQGRNPWQFAPKGAGTATKFPTTMVVELSPIDRELIAAGKPVQVTIAASDVVKSTGASNEDDNRRGGA